MKFFITLSFLFIYVIAISQVDKVNINWRNDNKVAKSSEENINLSQLNANYFDYDDGRQSLNYTHFFNLNSTNYRLSNVQSVVVSEKISNQINAIPDELSYEFKLAQGPDFTKLALILNPFYSENNSIYRIVSFEVVPTATSPSSATNNRNDNLSKNNSAVSNSIFNSGNVFKFYVENTGAHRLDFSFLRSLGITETTIPSGNLKIFGHGGGMLPLKNEENLYFDPPELSIQVFDGGDGVFNSGDYILFYATNTEGWSEENQTNLNLYADRSYYYLTVNSSGGIRMLTLEEPAATTTITEFDDYQFYEVDETSLSLVGRKWFGDRFDVETERTYEFTFPDLVQSEPIQLNINLGAISPLRSSFTVSINGQPLSNPFNLSATRANNPSSGAEFSTQVKSSTDEVTIKLTYNKNGNPGARGFLDYISLQARRDLTASEAQFKFKNTDVGTLQGVGEYLIQNSSEVDQVWDITDPIKPSFMSNPNGDGANVFSFKSPLGSAKEFQAVTSTYLSPSIESGNVQVPRQNLKGSIFTNAQGQFQDIDYLIVTRSDFMSAANRLAQHRRDNDGLVVKTVTVEDIYEEFNSGKQDIGAIRNFVKYIYDNASSPENRIKFLGLIGDASVDYKNRLQGNTNIVPTYQSLGSFSTTVLSFMSDDFFVMMDSNEGQMGSG